MTHSYTYKHQNNLSNELLFDEMPIKDEDIAEVTFRPFSESLTFLMKNAGYTGKDTPTDKAAFVIEALHDIGLDVTHQTIFDWFEDKTVPDHTKDSRKIIIALCFALHLNSEQVKYLFEHVCFDRALNCRDASEAIFAYCLHAGKSYSHAREMIEQLPAAPAAPDPDDEVPYTAELAREVMKFRDDAELLQYISKNRSRFYVNNYSAREQLDKLLSEVRGSDADAEYFRSQVKLVKQHRATSAQDNSACGFVVREALSKISGIESIEQFQKKQVKSIDFMLWIIFDFDAHSKDLPSFQKDALLKRVIRQNFPSKKLFSDVLNGRNQQYDAIRKAIILLKFYQFQMNWELDEKNPPEDERYDNFVGEMDHILVSCDLPLLYAGHPYDWIFLYSSKQEDPLATFRNILSDAIPEFS